MLHKIVDKVRKAKNQSENRKDMTQTVQNVTLRLPSQTKFVKLFSKTKRKIKRVERYVKDCDM